MHDRLLYNLAAGLQNFACCAFVRVAIEPNARSSVTTDTSPLPTWVPKVYSIEASSNLLHTTQSGKLPWSSYVFNMDGDVITPLVQCAPWTGRIVLTSGTPGKKPPPGLYAIAWMTADLGSRIATALLGCLFE